MCQTSSASTIKSLYKFILFLALSISLLSCKSTTYTSVHGEKIHQEEPLDLALLKEHGDVYTQRDPRLIDVSDYKPFPNETYEQYQARIHNTLTLQDYQLDSLLHSTKEKTASLANLGEQFAQLEAQNVDLRLLVANKHYEEETQNTLTRSGFTTHEVLKGDTLQKISKNYYGTHTAWIAIYRFNMKELPRGPNRVEIGQKLLIPSAVR
ncbi:MAG: hypothetical protein CMO81_09870 [Waddliaceae bacterium]|nr:hypothetical protein [Waddliaceae bacterium]